LIPGCNSRGGEKWLGVLGTKRVEERIFAPLPAHSADPPEIDHNMFSLVSQKVMPQPPSANKKKNYEIQEVLGTGSFGKVMVRPSSRAAHARLSL
jgi:hypothetical protein